MRTWKRRKREKVQATLAYAFWEFHKLKSLDHQTAQLGIEISETGPLLSVNTAAWQTQIKRVTESLVDFFSCHKKKMLVVLSDTLGKGLVADLAVSCQLHFTSQRSWQ